MFEINLVPDVKAEMIQAQKKRNVVLFASLAVSAVAVAIVLILLGVKVGQDIAINNQDSRLKEMSNTIGRYEGLDNLLTVQKQLSDLQSISNNKTLLSRVFTVLYSIVQQQNGDEIKISSLDVNMETATLTFDGQADAGSATDGNDFRVLDSFAKSVGLMKYDYGRYVDENGKDIPVMCIFESDAQGVLYSDDKGVYAKWAKGAEGCDPSKEEESEGSIDINDDSDDADSDSSDASTEKIQLGDIDPNGPIDDVKLVQIYRTPQFTDWYTKRKLDQDGSLLMGMDLDGNIKGIAHFDSQCIKYSGVQSGGVVNWVSENNECIMAPEGIKINQSTNGRQAAGKLVAMFSAELQLDPEIFSFTKKHVITILPSGHQNVTDSFIQVGDMFAERASELNSGEE